MTDTIYVEVEKHDLKEITASVQDMVRIVKTYVPGYRLRVPPLLDEKKVTIIVEVEGAGDFLPKYAGNLDIMTSAALAVGERLAARLLGKEREARWEANVAYTL